MDRPNEFTFDEREQVSVDQVRVCRGHSVGQSGTRLQRPVLEQLGRSGAGGRKRADLVVLSGVLAWADLGLRLPERYLAPPVMLEITRYMNVGPPGPEQRLYSYFGAGTKYRDSAIVNPTQACQPKAEVIVGMIDLVAAPTVVLMKN